MSAQYYCRAIKAIILPAHALLPSILQNIGGKIQDSRFKIQDSRFKMFIQHQIIRTDDKIIQQYSTVWHIWYTQGKLYIYIVDTISTLQTVVINISVESNK